MAKNKRNRVYRLTPRRKAALKKAQIASARKRSRRGKRALGVVGATIVAGGAVGAIYAHKRHQSNIVSAMNRKQKANTEHIQRVIGNQLALPAAPRKVTVLQMGYIGPRKMSGPALKPSEERIFKVSSKGLVTKTTKERLIYDQRSRRAYWQSKPVGGGKAGTRSSKTARNRTTKKYKKSRQPKRR